jgi:hypothetical protein
VAGVAIVGSVVALLVFLRVRGRLRRAVERTGDAQTWAAAGGAKYARVPSWRGRGRRRAVR